MDYTMQLEILREEFIKGIFHVNNTRKYLFPTLYIYGTEFMSYLRSLEFVMAAGIEDHSDFAPEFVHSKPHIYVLFAVTSNQKGEFKLTLNAVRKHESYITDYVWGDPVFDIFHMIVLEIPEDFKKSYNCFLRSQYSRIYTQKFIGDFFVKKKNHWRKGTRKANSIACYNEMTKDAFLVLTKNEEKRISLMERLGTTISKKAEYDEVLHPEREIFYFDGTIRNKILHKIEKQRKKNEEQFIFNTRR